MANFELSEWAQTLNFELQTLNFILYILSFSFSLISYLSFAQNSPATGTLVKAQILKNGDTIYTYTYPDIYIFANRVFKTNKEQKIYNKLVHNVKKVYPYAKLAGEILNKYNKILENIPTERERKKIMKQAEDDLRAKYEGELMKLTYSQGKILIKLIYRETQNTCFILIKDLRGAFPAFFWQQIARLFDYNLKTIYDPQGEDKMIEDIVIAIEQGKL